ncbi:hypothetical protein MWU75_10635 [Ornithinimicrobium sp. F0845]|uniref:hypothetical protein n=1 Tax=Ornithinimicrobium sp. F0845 TaxID=2926412 RepID=UPI001FF64E44|nr:hypothetical protein [Ornithinimicrobium sp. F0845]MCK0112596.1 hypothetical protein [Ornithinimicrobium sp. F0845]
MTEGGATAVHAPVHRGWWRRNRWALLALPVVLVVVALSGAGRIATFWWPLEMTDGIETQVGEMTRFTDDYVDAGGEHERTLRIAVRDVVPDADPVTSRGEPVLGEGLLPEGTRLWQLQIDVEADPETVLSGCRIALVDADGRLAERDTTLLVWDAGWDACQPVDTANPSAQLFVDEGEHERSTRPPAYSRTVQLLAAGDFEPIAVRVWWEPPTYLTARLPDAGR